MGITGESGIRCGKLIKGTVEKPCSREPPGDVLTPVAARKSSTARGGQVDLPPALVQILGDLAARLACAYHQHGAGRQHLRVMVLTCGHLTDVHGQSGTRCGKLRLWVSACCQHHIASFARHLLCLYQVALTSWLLPDRGDSDAAVKQGMKGRSVLLEVRHDVLSWEEAIRIVALIRKARKLSYPVRRVEGERIPPPAPPGLTHSALFKHEVCSALPG